MKFFLIAFAIAFAINAGAEQKLVPHPETASLRASINKIALPKSTRVEVEKSQAFDLVENGQTQFTIAAAKSVFTRDDKSVSESCAVLIIPPNSNGKYIELTTHSEENDWACNRVLGVGIYGDSNKHAAIIAITEMPETDDRTTRMPFVLTWNDATNEYGIDYDWCSIVRRMRGSLYITIPNVRRVMDEAINPK